MTEKEIQLLGFKREEGLYNDFYYYTYYIANGFGFISCSDDEVGKDGKWFIEFFDSHPQIRFDKFEEVQSLINLLEKRIIK